MKSEIKKKSYLIGSFLALLCYSCQKNSTSTPPHGTPFTFSAAVLNSTPLSGTAIYNANNNPVIKLSFSAPVNPATVASGISLTGAGTYITTNVSYGSNDSIVILQPASPLKSLTSYSVNITRALKSAVDSTLKTAATLGFITAIDSTDKFPRISDTALLTLVQQQTFKYFWDFGHPVSGLARERNSSGDIVTTGGSGFGVMAMIVGVQRNFISRADALTRLTTIVNFLTNNVTRYHGAFSHWINGATGATVPFSSQDDGGDIVETSYMIQGLLCARQYFNSTTDTNEVNLRNNINAIYNAVDWNWYRQSGQNVLTWNWSPDQGWVINVQVRGWCEALITYVMAASSNTDSIPKIVYDNGWAGNGSMKNGNSYYNIVLPLGPELGGPLFFAHYSFLGINPNSLTDAYANYWTQDTAHTKINYNYCVANPHKFNGYSNLCWGLTASDENNGYSAHAPDNDDGVISPTAAISSLPYAPTESMNALRFFYYTLGDKIWGQYGFVDAFNLSQLWFANSYLAIDQGPQIIMIENYRTGLLWNLFMSCPEVQRGMTNLGFQSPNL